MSGDMFGGHRGGGAAGTLGAEAREAAPLCAQGHPQQGAPQPTWCSGQCPLSRFIPSFSVPGRDERSEGNFCLVWEGGASWQSPVRRLSSGASCVRTGSQNEAGGGHGYHQAEGLGG